jgi:hypothetical protein
MEKAVTSFHESQFIIENMAGEDDPHKSFTPELEYDDEVVMLPGHFLVGSLPITGQRISPKNCRFQDQYTISFWQPPKIS